MGSVARRVWLVICIEAAPRYKQDEWLPSKLEPLQVLQVLHCECKQHSTMSSLKGLQ